MKLSFGSDKEDRDEIENRVKAQTDLNRRADSVLRERVTSSGLCSKSETDRGTVQ